MKKIVIIGAGVGGLSAVNGLAESGCQIEIFEKAEKGKVGWPWYDDIRFDMFEKANIPLIDSKYYCQKGSWLFVSPDEKSSLAVPPAKPMEEISISRRALAEHLLSIAEKQATVHYGKAVEGLIIKDGKVVGVTVDGKAVEADLVIDASGFGSPFRGQVPERFGIQPSPKQSQTMFAYRAFYTPAEGFTRPHPDCTLYVKHLGEVGISWCNFNHEGLVDVLIGKIGSPLSDEYITRALADLAANHDMLGGQPARPAVKTVISVRYPLSRMVADGYVAVGDSAFMTMPIMGSGIESSTWAGSRLAEVIKGCKDFSAAELWPYQVEFERKLGADFVFIDVMKNWLLAIKPQTISKVFSSGLVTDDDLNLFLTTSDEKVKIPAKVILKKVCIGLKFTGLLLRALPTLSRALKAKKLAAKVPENYDEKRVAAWQKKLDGVATKKGLEVK